MSTVWCMIPYMVTPQAKAEYARQYRAQKRADLVASGALIASRRNTPEVAAATLARRSQRSPSGCLLWTGYVAPKTGYGVISVLGRQVKVHRLAWTVARGPIPDGLYVCHTCDVRNCIEPTHLWLGTYADNNADAKAKGRQITPAGWNKGRPHSAETRAKIAARAQARPSRRHTPESRAKMSASRAAWWQRRGELT